MHTIPTRFTHCAPPQPQELKAVKKTVEMQKAVRKFAGNSGPSHVTTMERIGWRVTPAAYQGR
jgi:hypothetical protein